jgi:hypothetical protein
MKSNLRKFALAASGFAFAVLFSFGWSEQSGLSVSIEKAEAGVGRPLTPVSVAGVARRQYRRAAIGTAAAVGATGAYYGVRVTTVALSVEPERPTMVATPPQRAFLTVATLTTQCGLTTRAAPGTATAVGLTTRGATGSSARPVALSSLTTA